MDSLQVPSIKILLAEDDALTLMSYALQFKEAGLTLRLPNGKELSSFASVYNQAMTQPVPLSLDQHELHLAVGEAAVNEAVMKHEYDACILDYSLRYGTSLEATTHILIQEKEPVILLNSVNAEQQLFDIKSRCNFLTQDLQDKGKIHLINMKSMTEILNHLGPMLGVPQRANILRSVQSFQSNTIK